MTAGAAHEIDHHHDELEFNLVLRGSGSYRIGAAEHALTPGILMWLVPGQRHSLRRLPNLEMWVVVVRSDLADAAWLPHLAAAPARPLPGEELIDLDILLRQVAQDSDQPAVYNAGIGYALQRAWRVSRDREGPRTPIHPAVTRALLRLRERPGTLSLGELATGAGVSAPYLSHLLVEQTGRGFVEWRNRIRLERFMAAWRPGASILDVALEAGFGSYAQFHRTFTLLMGRTPGQWTKAPDASTATVEQAAGIQVATVLSARQRWTSMLEVVAPSLRPLLGADFLARLLHAAPNPQHRVAALERLDGRLGTAALAGFAADLGVRGAEFGRVLAGHDFGGVLDRVFGHYGLSRADPVDAATALLMALWVAATRAADPSVAQVAVVRRQVRGALADRLTRAEAQAAHTALLCHFVIAHHALQAARASGDARELDLLADVARRFGASAFAGDLAALRLTDGGLAA